MYIGVMIHITYLPIHPSPSIFSLFLFCLLPFHYSNERQHLIFLSMYSPLLSLFLPSVQNANSNANEKENDGKDGKGGAIDVNAAIITLIPHSLTHSTQSQGLA